MPDGCRDALQGRARSFGEGFDQSATVAPIARDATFEILAAGDQATRIIGRLGGHATAAAAAWLRDLVQILALVVRHEFVNTLGAERIRFDGAVFLVAESVELDSAGLAARQHAASVIIGPGDIALAALIGDAGQCVALGDVLVVVLAGRGIGIGHLAQIAKAIVLE